MEEDKETSASEDVKENGQSQQKGIDWNISLYPPTKEWKEGDILEGIITKNDCIEIGGRDAFLCHIKTEEKEYTVWLGGVLHDYFVKENVNVGDYIGIKYLGVVKGERGFKYHNFEIRKGAKR